MLNRRSFLGLSFGALVSRFLPKPKASYNCTFVSGPPPELQNRIRVYYDNNFITKLEACTALDAFNGYKEIPVNGNQTIKFFRYNPLERGNNETV